MELCDVVDKSGTHTGRVVPRGTKLESGEFYLVVHVWIKDQNDNYLIQQRALHLVSSPGVWAVTVGYVQAAEESVMGAIREVKEELGIQLSPTHLRKLDRHVIENRVEDVWLANVLRDFISVKLLKTEVADWKWVSKVELEQMANQGNFFRYSYLRDLLK